GLLARRADAGHSRDRCRHPALGAGGGPRVQEPAVTVLPAGRLPDLLNDDELLVENGFTVPEAAPAEVPAAMKGTTEGARAKADSLNTLDSQDAPARFGPTTPTRAARLFDASVDPTEARCAKVKGR